MSENRLDLDLVSIILPVYNTKVFFLLRSINSVLLQDYKNLELLIVDDGSYEEIAKTCDELAQSDKRIKVIHQRHTGVSSARNLGIEKAHGKYLMFVDADDELLPDILAQSVSIVQDNNLDILYGTVVDRSAEGDYIRTLNFPQNETLKIYNDKNQLSVIQEYFLAHETPDSSIAPKGLNVGPYNKLFRRSIIGSVRFDEDLSILEDAVFNSEVVAKASRIGLQNKPWYIYYKQDFSALHSLSIDDGAEKHCAALKQHATNEQSLNACYMNMCEYLFFALRAITRRNRHDYSKTIKQAINRPCFKEALKNVNWKRYELDRSTRLRYTLAQNDHAFLLMLCYRARQINLSK